MSILFFFFGCFGVVLGVFSGRVHLNLGIFASFRYTLNLPHTVSCVHCEQTSQQLKQDREKGLFLGITVFK